MLGMGLTLRFADFREVLRQPKWISIGVALQFLIMPLAGLVCSKVCGLNKELALGLILVGCCPGGTASNVICYLARANVALSVLLTMCSTFVAVFLTPLLTQCLAGQLMPVDAWGLFRSMIEVVLIPLVCGLLINSMIDRNACREKCHRCIAVLGPMLSVAVIVLVVASIVAGRKEEIAGAGPMLFLAVFGMHALGFLLGYLISLMLGGDRAQCRTVSVEVGMQNSGLGASLAKQHFAQLVMAPVPAAISAVFHSLIGSFLAWWWSRRETMSDP
ncbi:MAG: hypothetical protein RI957_222 [Verrucomicrobiota bacterium]